jgi:hypothetical protein
MVDLHREPVGRRAIGDISVYRQIVGRRGQENDLASAARVGGIPKDRKCGLVADRQRRVTSDRWRPRLGENVETSVGSRISVSISELLPRTAPATFLHQSILKNESQRLARLSPNLGENLPRRPLALPQGDRPRRPQRHRVSLRSERCIQCAATACSQVYWPRVVRNLSAIPLSNVTTVTSKMRGFAMRRSAACSSFALIA